MTAELSNLYLLAYAILKVLWMTKLGLAVIGIVWYECVYLKNKKVLPFRKPSDPARRRREDRRAA